MGIISELKIKLSNSELMISNSKQKFSDISDDILKRKKELSSASEKLENLEEVFAIKGTIRMED